VVGRELSWMIDSSSYRTFWNFVERTYKIPLQLFNMMPLSQDFIDWKKYLTPEMYLAALFYLESEKKSKHISYQDIGDLLGRAFSKNKIEAAGSVLVEKKLISLRNIPNKKWNYVSINADSMKDLWVTMPLSKKSQQSVKKSKNKKTASKKPIPVQKEQQLSDM